MADDVEKLYQARPEEFTELRTKLVAAAKKRGDKAESKRIASFRKPTTAAWVVNTLARSGDTTQRLADLGERLRAAHAARDGAGIRALSAAQRKLIDGLVRDGLTAAEVANPSQALRDDITGTLHAAIADPDVLARLGTLAKAERWSGFGEFAFDDTESAPEEAPDEEDEEDEEAEAARVEAERAQQEKERARQQAEADLEAARAELRTAERKRDAAQKVVDDAARRVDELSVLAGRDGRRQRGAVTGRARDA
jgi:Skp family chaperone for outer membrane proteins